LLKYFDLGESNEYLVVPASSINENGNECDKAGVGFAAFAKQPDRCGHVSGTCLKNQPLAYRRHDAVRMTGAINETTLEITFLSSGYTWADPIPLRKRRARETL